MLTHAQLLAILHYDPLTGIFTRLQSPGRGRIKAGDRAGYLDTSRGYWKIYVAGRYYYASRLAWFYMKGAWPPDEVDHENGVRDNDRWSNLRLATPVQNRKNRSVHRNSKSGRKGVSPKAGRWVAQICHEGKVRHLGLFGTIELAGQAYDRAAEQYHAEFNRK